MSSILMNLVHCPYNQFSCVCVCMCVVEGGGGGGRNEINFKCYVNLATGIVRVANKYYLVRTNTYDYVLVQ